MNQHQSKKVSSSLSRRALLQGCAAGLVAASARTPLAARGDQAAAPNHVRPWLRIRGIYGGFPSEFLERGGKPTDYGVNAIWVGSGSLHAVEIDRYHRLGLQVFAEFNSMHSASYLRDHPDAAPIGPDGQGRGVEAGVHLVSPGVIGGHHTSNPPQ